MVVVVFAVAWYFTAERAEKTARETVLSEAVLAQIAARVRPSIVIDSSGNFSNDQAGSEYIKEAVFEFGPEKYEAFLTLKIDRPLINPPAVTCLTPLLYVHEVSQAGGFNWRVNLRAKTITDIDHSISVLTNEGEDVENMILTTYPISRTNTYKFLVEILH